MYKGQILVKSLKLSRSALTLKQGRTFDLNVTVNPTNASIKKVNWKSSNPAIATVSSTGVVKAIKNGTIVIYAHSKDGDKIAKCKVNIK